MGSVFKLRVDTDGRECTKCVLYQPWDNFWRCSVKNNSTGHFSECKGCWRERTEAQGDYHWKYGLKRFNITAEEYTFLLAQQGGVCALCHKPECAKRNGKVRRLAVDHDRRCCPGNYSCGQCIRGLLCYACNVTIGRLEHLGILEQAVIYRDSRPLVVA